MIDQPIEKLPWEDIHAELSKLAGEEAWRLPVPHGAADDAAQEACAKLIQIGVRGLPPDLIGDRRGRWLRPFVRHVLFAMARAEDRWRHANGPAGAENGPRPSGMPSLPTLDEPVDLSVLPPAEWRVVTFWRLNLTATEIAELEGIDATDVLRHARWGAFRLRLPNPRRTWQFGQRPGSLAQFRGPKRRAVAEMLLQNGWSVAELAVEFATTPGSVRVTQARGADRPQSNEF